MSVRFALSALAIALFASSAAHAGSGYTVIPELEAKLPAEPKLPTKVCTVLPAKLQQTSGRLPDSIDADPANSSPDGARLQAAINACPAGQAVKLVSDASNNAFLSGPFLIKSGVTLWVDAGVTLFASRSPKDYDVGDGPDAGFCGTADAKHKNGCNPWINANDTVGSGLVGDGIVDARGGAVLTSGPHANKVTWWDLSIQSKAKPALQQNNPRMIQVLGGKQFTLYRITLTNAPKFHVGTTEANDFVAWGVKLITPSLAYSVPGYACAPGTMPEAGKWKISTCFQPENVKNTDGIDPGNSRNVTIAYSFISTGDDHIAVKAGANLISQAPSANHLYAHNRLYYGHGLSIGSETDTHLSDVSVWDLAVDGQDSTHGLGIRIKSDASRGGEVSKISYRHVCMRRVAEPLVFDPYYGNSKSKGLFPNFHDITLQDVRTTGLYGPDQNGGSVVFSGYAGDGIKRPLQITLNNVYFDAAPSFEKEPYHDVKFTLGAGSNLNPPAGPDVEVKKISGKATPIDCPDAVFVKFPLSDLAHLIYRYLTPASILSANASPGRWPTKTPLLSTGEIVALAMRRSAMRMLVMLSLLCGTVCTHAAEPLRWQADSAEQTTLQTAADTRYNKLFMQGQLRDRMTSVDTAALLLDTVATQGKPEHISQMLDALSALQDHDPASKTYGNIFWYQGDTRIVDRNGIEFVGRQLTLLWRLYADQLTAAQRASLRGILELARIGIQRHTVAVSYTNIYLMKAWNLIALGDGLSDAASAAQGHAMLSEWLVHTQATGINEYLSPSYFPIDLENLSLIRNLALDPSNSQLAQAGLDWLWEDIALNWYGPAERLGGTHSRDYDRLYNVGGLNPLVARAGWTGQEQNRSAAARNPFGAYAWVAPDTQRSHWLQGPFPRLVGGRFGEAPEKRYLHYMAHDFSIASAQTGYNVGHDNSPLVINLGSGQDVPIINFFMDGRRDYYGQNKTLEAGSGHMKALHLRPFLSSVQRDNQVLFIASVRDSSPELSALESVITLPADAEYWINDKRIDVFSTISRWTADPDGDGEHTGLDISNTPAGPALKISDQDRTRGVGVSRSIAVQAGKTYRLRALLQGEQVFLYLNFLDANGHLIGTEHAIRVTGGDGEAIWREHTVQAPAGAQSCKVWLYSTTGNLTTVQVRDLRIEEISDRGDVLSLLGSFDFHPYQPQQFVLPNGATLFVRRQGVVAALRPLGTWSVTGQPVDWALFNDGLKLHALRIAATHSASRTDARASLAFWAMVQNDLASDTAFSDFRHAVLARQGKAVLNGSTLDASLTGDTVLHLAADIEAGRVLTREGMSPEPSDQARWVRTTNFDTVPLVH